MNDPLTVPARDGIEAQRGLNDIFPGDPYPVRDQLKRGLDALRAQASRGKITSAEVFNLTDPLMDILARCPATPRPEASDAPDIVPVAWRYRHPLNSNLWVVVEGADWPERDPAMQPLYGPDALAALRAELAATKAENRELMMQDDPAFTHAFKRRAEAAEAEVARLTAELAARSLTEGRDV